MNILNFFRRLFLRLEIFLNQIVSKPKTTKCPWCISTVKEKDIESHKKNCWHNRPKRTLLNAGNWPTFLVKKNN